MYASEMLEGHWGHEQVCTCFLYMSLILTMGRKSVVVCAVFVFGSTWNIVLFQDDGISPRMQHLVHDARDSCHNIVRRKMQQFSHQPTLVLSFVFFCRLIGLFNSCKLQSVSNAMVGLDYLDVHEKYFPTCLRNHWLEDAVRTDERWCVALSATISIGLTCSTTVEVFKISIREARVDAILQR